jgi:hypothetical protein
VVVVAAASVLAEYANPDSARTRLFAEVDTDALVVSEIQPLSLAPVWGAKMMLRLTLCPGFSVIGGFGPPNWKPVPSIAACETVTIESLVLVNVADLVWWLPSITVPKLMLAGADSWLRATPLPDSNTVAVVLDALLEIEIVPVTLPVALGVKARLKVVL